MNYITTLRCDLDLNFDQSEAIVKIINIYSEILTAVLKADTIALFRKGDLTVELFTKAFEYETNLWRNTSVSPRVTEIAIQTFYENTSITDTIVDMVNANKLVEPLHFIDGLSTGSFTNIRIPMPDYAFNQHSRLLSIPGANTDIDISDYMDSKFYALGLGNLNASNLSIEKIFISIGPNQTPRLEINLIKKPETNMNDRKDATSRSQETAPSTEVMSEFMSFPDHKPLLTASSQLSGFQTSRITEPDSDISAVIENALWHNCITARTGFLSELYFWVTHNSRVLAAHYIEKERKPNQLDGGIVFPFEAERDHIGKAVSNVVLHTIKQSAIMRKPHQNVTVKDLLINIDIIIERECGSPERTLKLLKSVASSLLLFGLADFINDGSSTSHLTVILDLIQPEWVGGSLNT